MFDIHFSISFSAPSSLWSWNRAGFDGDFLKRLWASIKNTKAQSTVDAQLFFLHCSREIKFLAALQAPNRVDLSEFSARAFLSALWYCEFNFRIKWKLEKVYRILWRLLHVCDLLSDEFNGIAKALRARQFILKLIMEMNEDIQLKITVG